MSVHYALPTPEDFLELSGPRQFALTVYAETSPIVGEREASLARVKSGIDAALEVVKRSGAPSAIHAQLAGQRDRLFADDALWGNLAASMAVFLEPGRSEVFVLPNRLETQWQSAPYFDLGQLFRVRTFPQRAHAILVSANGWSLWRATATDRAARVPLRDPHPLNVEEGTNRDLAPGGRDNVRRLIGEEGRKVLLEAYAKRVCDAVVREFNSGEVPRDEPVFVFAAEPLSSMLLSRGLGPWRAVGVLGAPDHLEAAEIDRAIRQRLRESNAASVRDRVEAIANGAAAGLVETQLSAIARAAIAAAVDTLVFDFTRDLFGVLDPSTGTIELAPPGERTLEDGREAYDLLSAIALAVLRGGGSVIAVREGEVDSPLWNGEALAQLRHALA